MLCKDGRRILEKFFVGAGASDLFNVASSSPERMSRAMPGIVGCSSVRALGGFAFVSEMVAFAETENWFRFVGLDDAHYLQELMALETLISSP